MGNVDSTKHIYTLSLRINHVKRLLHFTIDIRYEFQCFFKCKVERQKFKLHNLKLKFEIQNQNPKFKIGFGN